MNKRVLRRIHVRIRPIKIRYIVLILIISLGVSVYALRQNNLTAVRLRDKVLNVDKQNGDVESAMRELRAYVYAHMNTDLASGPSAIKPPVQLKYSYERLVAAEKARVSTINEKVYGDAQAKCEQLFPKGLSGSGRIPCIKDYISKHGATEQPIQDSLYKFDFSSPKWSFDVAGVALLISSVVLVLLITRVILDQWLKKQLHDHM